MVNLERQSPLNLWYPTGVNIIGCGGIGFWAAKFAALAGVKAISLYDEDEIEVHNLNRLPIPEDAIGKRKTTVLKDIIEWLRPDITVIENGYVEIPVNHIDAFPTIDCTDKINIQIEICRYCKKNNIPYIKAGYDGLQISIVSDIENVKGIENARDGYRVIPSFVAPAVAVAAVAIQWLMSGKNSEESGQFRQIIFSADMGQI